jgi:hypothetical protein
MVARLFPTAPALVAAAFVLTVFADSGYTLSSLPRPLILAVTTAVVVQLGVSALVRNLTIGTVVSSIVVVGVIDPRFLLLLGAIAVGAWVYSRKRRQSLSVKVAVVVPIILFSISLVRAVASEAFVVADLFPGNAIEQTAQGPAERPNIYVVLLDGYPRADTLRSVGIDNRPFLSALSERQFDVASSSHGNYPFTSQVLTSMLQMAHLTSVESLHPPPRSPVGQMRAMGEAVRRSPAIETLDRHGYRTLSAGLPGDPTTPRGVDEYIDPGMMTVFEHQVLRRSALWGVLEEPWVLPHLRAQIRQTFDIVESVAAAERSEPVFLFAHVMSPHTPFVFDQAGDVPTLSCEPTCERWTIFAAAIGIADDEYWARYGEQIGWVNEFVLSAVDTIIENDPGAVVVLLSDHGARATPHDLDEWYRTFFAARTPGHAGLFDDDARSLEVFPRLLEAYLGEEFAIPPDVTYRYADNPTDGLRHQLEVVEIRVDSTGSPDGETSGPVLDGS